MTDGCRPTSRGTWVTREITTHPGHGLWWWLSHRADTVEEDTAGEKSHDRAYKHLAKESFGVHICSGSMLAECDEIGCLLLLRGEFGPGSLLTFGELRLEVGLLIGGHALPSSVEVDEGRGRDRVGQSSGHGDSSGSQRSQHDCNLIAYILDGRDASVGTGYGTGLAQPVRGIGRDAAQSPSARTKQSESRRNFPFISGTSSDDTSETRLACAFDCIQGMIMLVSCYGLSGLSRLRLRFASIRGETLRR